jgi:ATP-dependent Clp protease protease subunit
MFRNVKKKINAGIIDKIKDVAGSKKKDDKIVLIDADALGGGPEPDMRSIGLFSDVSDEKVAEIVQAILYLNELNKGEKDEEKKKPIDFYICTYGGSADDMFALYDIINIIKQDTEIHTIGVGKVMSAGVLLLASGTQGKRKIGKHCRVMIHNVIGGNHGSLPNLANELEAIQTLQDDYVNALVDNTKLTKKKLTKMLNEKVNVYLSAEEAVELGIADIII